MSLLRSVLCVGIGAIAAAANPLASQSLSRPFAVVTVGPGNTTGGEYEERDVASFDLLAGYRLKQEKLLSVFSGAFAGLTFKNGSDLTCRIRPGLNGCVPLMPTIVFAGIMAGVATRPASRTSLAIAAGPALVQAGSLATGRALGLDGRIDASVRIAGPVGLALSGRNLLMPNFRGSTLILRSVSVGLRLQWRL